MIFYEDTFFLYLLLYLTNITYKVSYHIRKKDQAPTALTIASIERLLGLSIGKPRALSQINCARGPKPLDTPKVTV